MKAAALSPYAMTLPSSNRSTALVEVSGRQKVVRLGMFFTTVGKHRRTVYENLDGEIILADACKCEIYWRPSLQTVRSVNCPINQHSILARQAEAA